MEHILHDTKLVKNFNVESTKCLSILTGNFYIVDFILWQFLLFLPVFFFNALNILTRHLEHLIIALPLDGRTC